MVNTAGIDVAIWVPPLVAFVISFFTSMGGVSGAFLLLPFQMSVLGITTPSVSATNQLFNVVAIPSGVYRYVKEGRMVWPLTRAVAIGTLPGVLIGVVIRVVWLPDPVKFKLFAALVLFFIGGRLVWGLIQEKTNRRAVLAEVRFQELVRKHRKRGETQDGKLPPVRVLRTGRMRIAYEFYGEAYEVSSWRIYGLAFVVGIAGGVYGVGGGAIMAPLFVSFFGLPVYTVAGAALMGTFVTSVAAVAFFQAIAPFYPEMSVAPDWKLGLLFGLGGAVGMYLGARCQKFVPARAIKWLLGGVITIVATRYAWEFFSR